MPSADRDHFNSYRLQTRIKHAILEGYLPAYFNVIKSQHSKLLYFDGFAGRGHYESGDKTFPGSPLLALQIVADNPDFAERVLCIYNEKRRGFFNELEASVTAFYEDHLHIKKPVVAHGRFSEHVDALLEGIGPGYQLVPTFLFVDPCGVDDVSMERIANILARPTCEVFIFFNLDGIRRVAGLAAARGDSNRILEDLYGSKETAADMIAQFTATDDAALREAIIVGTYRNALRKAAGAEYILPLRVEDANRATTSHYLLHATKHPLGFKIMKQVMWKSGGGIECEGDTLALLQASKSGTARLFRPELDALHREILAKLAGGPTRVKVFRDDWVCRPDDFYSDAIYRRELLALESAHKIQVLKEDATTPFPPNERRQRLGQPTLATRLYVRLSEGSSGI